MTMVDQEFLILINLGRSLYEIKGWRNYTVESYGVNLV